MGFPNRFYCVCEGPDCPWNKPGFQAFGCIEHVGGERIVVPDDRPSRILGSRYWNTCWYFRIIVFEAMFIRTLRGLVQSRVVSLDALPKVLDHLVRQPRRDRELQRVHAQAILLIGYELHRLQREVGKMNGHLNEIAQLARALVFHKRIL